MVHPGGRPRKFTRKQEKELLQAFEEYIDTEDIPIIVDFCTKRKILKQNLYDREEFSTLLKRCTAKKEAALEKGMLYGDLVPSAAIFSLKQLGWSDKQQTEISGKDGGPIRITTAEDLTDDELANIAAGSRK